MDIPTLVFGSLGIVATIVVGAFGFQASTPGEFLLSRSLFVGSALLLAAAVFAVQWIADRPISPLRIFGTGFVGSIIFAGLSACLDWVNRKEIILGKETEIVPVPSTPKESKSERNIVTQHEPARNSEPDGQAMRGALSKEAKIEEKTTLQPPVVTFRDGPAQVSFSVNYHVEPADAPLVVVSIGDPNSVTEVLNPRVTSTVLAVLEPLSMTEARSRRLELQKTIEEQLRVELKKMGITIDTFSLIGIEPR
jgi:hypothetical protein